MRSSRVEGRGRVQARARSRSDSTQRGGTTRARSLGELDIHRIISTFEPRMQIIVHERVGETENCIMSWGYSIGHRGELPACSADVQQSCPCFPPLLDLVLSEFTSERAITLAWLLTGYDSTTRRCEAAGGCWSMGRVNRS
jgi:hypothetical protein